jgi:Domain of unknown function DUF302
MVVPVHYRRSFAPPSDYKCYAERFEANLSVPDQLLSGTVARYRPFCLCDLHEYAGGLLGGEACRRARLYVICHTAIAKQLMDCDVRAGLYAHVAILIYEDDTGSTQVEFEQPSTAIASLSNPRLEVMSRQLDVEVAVLVESSA